MSAGASVADEINDVFLSYAREDRERAGQLAHVLEARGWSVWWDREILAGQAFDQAIEKQLESARCIVVLWSKDSVSSEWVKNEAAVAAERGVLTPVTIDAVKLPLEFRRRQTISLIGWKGQENHPAFVELCHHVTAHINGTALPDGLGPLNVFKQRKSWVLAVAAVVVGLAALALGAYRVFLPDEQAVSSSAPDGAEASAKPAGKTASSTPSGSSTAGPPLTPRITLRRTPATLSSDMVKVLLVKHGLYDKNWNPGGQGVGNVYEPQIHGNTVVLFDRTTALTWQRGGSRDAMTFDAAKTYVQRLNEEKLAGFSDWRLPTLEEALSLMEPQAVEEMHIDPSFERGVNFIWTADTANEDRAWMIYFYDGIATTERNSFNAWVRAVR
jgi:hypothetical protein